MATKAKTYPPKKYLYAAIDDGGCIPCDAAGQASIAYTAKEARAIAVKQGRGRTIRVVRYVLESSIRPGGR